MTLFNSPKTVGEVPSVEDVLAALPDWPDA